MFKVYCDELIEAKNNYLFDFGKTIKKSQFFVIEKNIISKTNNDNELIIVKRISKIKLFFWDNLYANDYCQKKYFRALHRTI